VTLICVTKGIPVERLREALSLGVTDIGENRVQEARGKREALGAGAAGTRWHLIGHLQRNKAKHAVELFDAVHSVDSEPLARELDRHAQAAGKRLEVFVQVNVSGESTKSGVAPGQVVALAETVVSLKGLHLKGLMTIAPLTDDTARIREAFQGLRRLREELRAPAPLLLSMGMSQDFELAIEEGADLVRIGTALFGPRA
jgi:pyridoxal phosphate enzyme (YggS family)